MLKLHQNENKAKQEGHETTGSADQQSLDRIIPPQMTPAITVLTWLVFKKR